MSEELADPDIIDRIEAEFAAGPPVVMPVQHHFTNGLYIREIFMPKGTALTSMEHLTEHPFAVMTGEVKVISANEGAVIYKAPYWGITKPNTRRVLYAEEDTVWITFHPNHDNCRDVEAIGDRILAKHHNPLVPADRADQWKNPRLSPALEFKPALP